jgi:hypothetical protein
MTTYRLESDLSRAVIEFLNSVEGVWAFVTHGGPYQRAGIPDIVGCAYGRMFGCELKIGNKYPSPIQRKTLREIRDAGGMAITAWDLETVKEMIEVIRETVERESRA